VFQSAEQIERSEICDAEESKFICFRLDEKSAVMCAFVATKARTTSCGDGIFPSGKIFVTESSPRSKFEAL
jgi:hypothetical protein